jgi:ATP-dependent DNA ligase
MNNFVRLFKNHKNSIGFWEIWSEENVIFMQSATQLHSSPIRHSEVVKEGKQGRTVLQQTEFRIKSRVNSKLDHGYVTSVELAKGAPTDAEGKVKPMLATKIEDYRGKIDKKNSFIQLKYNGHRCLITKKDGEVYAYSRNGKKIPGIPHVLERVSLEEGEILDGELYAHEWPLQRIASAAKKLQADSRRLQFKCYDYVSEEPYERRLAILEKRIIDSQGYKSNSLHYVTTRRLSEIDDLGKVFENVKNAGYEGLIMRLNDAGYESGRRSKSLIKIKKLNGMGYYDAEFTVIDILASKQNWGILVCQLPSGGTFKVSAPGTIMEKMYVLQNKDKYIGRDVTVEYPELTADKVPFQPVALQWRKDL